MTNESGMDQSMQPEAQRVDMLRQSLPLVQAQIGRKLEGEEAKAIGFVLDRNEQAFASEVLDKGSNAQDSKWRIRQAIGNVTETEIGRRIAIASGQGDGDEMKKLSTIRNAIASLDADVRQRYEKGEDFSLGAVPEYFLPDWVKNYR